MIEYSAQSRYSVATLMQAYNDIDIFVEDDTYRGLYERLVNRILNGRARVQSVTALGCRKNVEDAAANDNSTRPRLYIVDGDLDLIARGRSAKINRLHRLSVYAVENLVIDSHAIHEYIEYSCPGLTIEEIDSKIDIPELMSELNEIGSRYFVLLAIARRLDLRGAEYRIDPKSVSREVGGRSIGFCKYKVGVRSREIVSSIIAAKGLKRYRSAKQFIIDRIKARSLKPIDYVSAKHFFIWMLNQRVSLAGGNANQQSAIVSHLAKNVKQVPDRSLAIKIRALGREANPMR